MYTQTLEGPKQLKRRGDKGMNGVLLAFLLGMAGALAILLPFFIADKGFYLYAGDYNQQQVPFNYYLQYFFKQVEGGGSWSWATDLGSSVVNSYSFYNLGSPYFWLSMLFPYRWMPYLMVPLFCLKFGSIAAAACLYFKRYAKSRNMAVIVSVLYAFCGFNIYNIFFNHMLEPVVLFPLMLWAMDGFVYERKRGWFAVSVGLALLNSYFFFAGNVVFLGLYFLVKVLLGEYRVTLSVFGQLVAEALLGVGLGMVLLMPAVLNLMGNPRISEHSDGFGLVMYSRVQQYFNIFFSMLVPQDTPWSPNVFTEGSIKWTSMSAYLPVLSLSGVIAYCRARKKSAAKWLLLICLVCAFVPFLNSSFYAFNSSYYARWYYMPIFIMCFATLRSLEDADIDLLGGVKITAALTALYGIFGLLPVKQDDGGYRLGVEQDTAKFWLTFLIAMVGVAVCYLVVRFYRYRTRFAPVLLSAIVGFTVFYSVIHIAEGKFGQWERDVAYKSHTYDAVEYIELPEDGAFYRIDVYDTDFDNIGLWLDKSCLQSFNSVITTATMEFYDSLGLVRDVRSNPDLALYGLRGLLSVEFTLVPLDKDGDFQLDIAQYGWEYYDTQGQYIIYRNQNFIPLGFTYNDYLRMDYLESTSNTDVRSALLVRGIGLDAEQEEKYAHLFAGSGAIRSIEDWDEDAGEYNVRYEYDVVNYDRYTTDAAARRATASYQNGYDSTGFWANITLEQENLVFFGVPYDSGFTATVNGEEVEIENVSGGMMAVLAPAGDNEIVFTYATPGLGFGASLTFLSIGLLVLYLAFFAWRKTQKKGGVLKPQKTKEAAKNGGDKKKK